VGTAETAEKAEQWISINSRGVPGDEKHPDFPGCASDRGFHSALEFNGNWTEVVTQTELEDLQHIHSRKLRFETALTLIEQKFQLLDRKDLKPDYVVLTLPESLSDKIFSINYEEKGLGMIHRDFRRAIKARVMKYKIPSQLIDQKTMEFRDPDHPAKIAWNFLHWTLLQSRRNTLGTNRAHPRHVLLGRSLLSRTRHCKSGDVHELGASL
jgi:hypothetical protein